MTTRELQAGGGSSAKDLYRDAGPTSRWSPLRYHDAQARFWSSTARFRMIAAGRRSGKTELAKRELILKAAEFSTHPDGWFVFAAPTHDQARRIFWEDVKKLVPKAWRRKPDSEGRMTIYLVNGAEITVLGMDKPSRIEGRALDGIHLDEFADMKPTAWESNVRPALSTDGRPGFAIFTGVPNGRNHFYRLWKKAKGRPDWETFSWVSADILPIAEVESAKEDLDPVTFAQEYEATFANFTGRAYYSFDYDVHGRERVAYDPSRDLIFCFDFNRSPGICVVVQELDYKGDSPMRFAEVVTAVVGEVYIERNSTTPAVCRRLVADWGDHPGKVLIYGDATGGTKKTSSVAGSDWDLVRAELRPTFGSRMKMKVDRANPPVRVRVNAVNSRLETADGLAHVLVDPVNAPMTANDLDSVITLSGGTGEIDKDHDEDLTHLSDGFGYYVAKKHPIRRQRLRNHAA